MVTPGEVAAAVAGAHRREWAFVLAATVRATRDIDRAEECVQDAYAQALRTWPTSGIPDRPGAWLTTVARRRAVDLARRDDVHRRSLPLLVDYQERGESSEEIPTAEDIDDDRLRLIFTCCHPALQADAQVALTLRLVCGLTTAEIARSFLVAETTMAARLTRAKKKIAAARIPYRVPPPEDLAARVEAVLTVVYLLFTTGHRSPLGDDLVDDQALTRSVDLARMLHGLLPDHPDTAGLLALILLTDARRAARVGPDGQLVLLADQDRCRWDHAMIAEGRALVRLALDRRRPGRFSVLAAIAAVHAEAESFAATDWAEIVSLYDIALGRWPSPVVALNRAVAVGFAQGPTAGLALLDDLVSEPALQGYSYLPSARADLLRRLGRHAESSVAYRQALALTDNGVERTFLGDRLRDVEH